MKKVIVLAGVLLMAGMAGLWFYGRPAYRHYKEKRALSQAQAFLAKGDWRNASLCARQALQVNRRNLQACQIMAGLAERASSPNLLDWRRTIVELDPTTENKLLLAAAALRLQGPPYPLAAQVLGELAGTAEPVASYHVVAAELALKLHNVPEAEAHFQKAALLEPTNELHQLNLSVLRLESTNSALAAAARSTLEGLRSSTNLGAVALRWLIAERLRRQDLAAAQNFSEELLSDAHANLDDRLQHLQILQQAKKTEFTSALTALQSSVQTNAAAIYGVCSWMIRNGLTAEAWTWVTNYPAKVQQEQPVPLALVDCYVSRKDWRGLEGFLQSLKWGELDFLRLAFLSHTFSEQKESMAAEAHWRLAVREAGDRLGPILALLSMANSWGLDKPKENLLWQIAQRFPRERWALGELDRFYKGTGNTRGLHKLYTMMASQDSRNVVAQNNLAATSLLLNLNISKAHDLAREIYYQHPNEPIIASTYAYSLFLQGHTNEALAAFEKLKPQELEKSAVALYYGVVLNASGQTNKAAKCVEIARLSSDAFLPEEKALLERMHQ